MKENLPQVGAPDPELKNSPIVDEGEYDPEEAPPLLEGEAPVEGATAEAAPAKAGDKKAPEKKE